MSQLHPRLCAAPFRETVRSRLPETECLPLCDAEDGVSLALYCRPPTHIILPNPVYIFLTEISIVLNPCCSMQAVWQNLNKPHKLPEAVMRWDANT